MNDLPFTQRPIKRGSRLVAPTGDFFRRINKNIRGYAQRPQQPLQSHHFLGTIFNMLLYDKKIEIRIFPCVAPCVGTKQHDACRLRGFREKPNCSLDFVVGYHCLFDNPFAIQHSAIPRHVASWLTRRASRTNYPSPW